MAVLKNTVSVHIWNENFFRYCCLTSLGKKSIFFLSVIFFFFEIFGSVVCKV